MTPQATIVARTIGTVPSSDEDGAPTIDLGPGAFVAYAARVSNPSNQLSDWSYAKLLAYLRRARHWSPFEMSNVVMECVTTRDIGRQFLRHHSFRFQEFSQRYAEATKFHVTFPARRQDIKNRQNSIDDMSAEDHAWWLGAQVEVAHVANNRYQEALRRGIAKELARKVLPEGLTETTFYANGYLRSWCHYLAQRLDPATQKEHRDLALACHRELARECPDVFDMDPFDVG